jgi:hypothetical protein
MKPSLPVIHVKTVLPQKHFPRFYGIVEFLKKPDMACFSAYSAPSPPATCVKVNSGMAAGVPFGLPSISHGF